MDELAPRQITAHDGTSYQLRPIVPDDAPSLMRGYDAMSDSSKWFRMLHALPHLTADMARAYTTPDTTKEVCLVVDGQGPLEGEILGGARVADLGPGKRAEFSVSVRPEARGLGLAKQSLEAVIEIARGRGCSAVWGYIDSHNEAMLSLARRIGMTIRFDPDDFTLRLAELSFAEPDHQAA